MTWVDLLQVVFFIGLLLSISYECGGEHYDFGNFDGLHVRSNVYQTELFLIDNTFHDKPTYRFEDFFWSGSGDGGDENGDHSTTTYETRTVTTTIYKNTPTSSYNNQTKETTKCDKNCLESTKPEEPISPTPTITTTEETTTESEENNFIDAGREFWILTLLKSDGKDPMIIDLKKSLEKLYKKAFQRQQDKHLGIASSRRKRRTASEKPVKVYIHKVDKQKQNGDENTEVLYHVAVAGKPVRAVTAVADMKLVTDDEVRQVLGYPFVIKAEPYLKENSPQNLLTGGRRPPQNTWLFIGGSIVGFLVLLLLLAFVFLVCKKKSTASAGIDNRRQIFEREADTIEKQCGAGVKDVRHRRNKEESPTYINFRNQPSSVQTVKRGTSTKQNVIYCSSSSSTTSLDISPLMAIKRHKTPPKKPPRPKAALNKTVPINIRPLPTELYDTDSMGSRSDSPNKVFVHNLDPGVMSPKSYLSMPSVKSFPRISNPESLNKVLEPVSVVHLDMPEDDDVDHPKRHQYFARHVSVGTGEDPGVIGPIVWDMHCQGIKHGTSVDEGIDDLKTTGNVTRMRKRLHDLLDDTFSLFGSSRKGSPVEDRKPQTIEVKSHSAVLPSRSDEDEIQQPRPRPRTSIQKPSEYLSNDPRTAWPSKTSSPLVRPVSAGPITPRVNVDQVLAEGKFLPNDPAIPLIAAIKSEIEKCSLPGSTSDLTK